MDDVNEQDEYENEYEQNEANRRRVHDVFQFGDECDQDKGAIVEEFCTGCHDAHAISHVYECGGICNENFADIPGDRTMGTFWDCSHCKRKELPRVHCVDILFNSNLLVKSLDESSNQNCTLDEFLNKILADHFQVTLDDKELYCLNPSVEDCDECDGCFQNNPHCHELDDAIDNWYETHPGEELPDV